MSWYDDSGKGQVKLPVLQVAPFATQQLQIWTMQKRLGIPDDVHWASVSLATNAAPDDLIAIASSRDCTGVFNVETAFGGNRSGHFAGGQWRVDATHNQLAAITNVGTQPTDALLTLHYDSGVQKYELQQTIAPGDQMWVNLAPLIRQRVPDRKGNFLPVDVSTATHDVQDLTPGGNSLMANDLAVNPAAGQAIPDYPRCCPYSNYYYNPDPVQVFYDGSAPYLIDALDSCNGTPYSVIDDFTSFSSSNTSIALFTKGQVQGVAPGQATGTAQGWLLAEGCVLIPVTVYQPIYVQPTISQDRPLWYFGLGNTPPSGFNLGGITATLTANGAGNGTYVWTITNGTTKATLETTRLQLPKQIPTRLESPARPIAPQQKM